MQTPEWFRSEELDTTGRERLNWWRILLLIIGLLGTVIFIIYLISDFKGKDEKEVREKTTATHKEPEIKFDELVYEDKVVTQQTAGVEKKTQTSDAEINEETEEEEEDPRKEILARLGKERFASFQMDHDKVANFQKVSGSLGIGACDIMPGTVAKIRLDTATSTDNGGVVTGRVSEPVPGHDGTCIALDGGETFTGIVDTNVEFGQSRTNIVFTSITDGGRVIEMQAPAGDAMGGGGVPGKVNRHWVSKIAGVAIATGVDLALARAGGGDGLNIMLGNSSSVLDDFARQFVNRKNTITTDPTQGGQIITVTFTQKVSM